MNERSSLRVAIIGAGPAGLAAGHELLEHGFTCFTIFEKSDAVGGTWHLQTYPGLACDVWAHSYTFSYAPNPEWSASFAERAEIEAYLQRCAVEFGLEPHLRFNTRIVAARYRREGIWAITTDRGEQLEFDVVISAMGNQHTPLFPAVDGIDSFTGPSWHATEWEHDVDLTGLRVAVIGSAAGAVQVVPELAKIVGHLTVLQRSANWIMPRGRRVYSPWKRALYRRSPALVRLTRKGQRFLMSLVHDATTLGHKRMEDFEKRARTFLRKSIPDETLRAALTPTSRFGCKRGLVSDDFYPALMLDHVELVPAGLARVAPRSIVTSDGREIEVDAIVYCTGYRILDFDRIDVVGRDGVSLADAMGAAPQAHKGIAAPGFPNFFFTVGPNGLILDVPYFVTVERNVKTIVRLLCDMQAAGAAAVGVRPETCRAYNEWLQQRFSRYSWGADSCSSYYRTASGHAPFLFPGDFSTYDRIHEEIGLDEFEPIPASSFR